MKILVSLCLLLFSLNAAAWETDFSTGRWWRGANTTQTSYASCALACQGQPTYSTYSPNASCGTYNGEYNNMPRWRCINSEHNFVLTNSKYVAPSNSTCTNISGGKVSCTCNAGYFEKDQTNFLTDGKSWSCQSIGTTKPEPIVVAIGSGVALSSAAVAMSVCPYLGPESGLCFAGTAAVAAVFAGIALLDTKDANGNPANVPDPCAAGNCIKVSLSNPATPTITSGQAAVTNNNGQLSVSGADLVDDPYESDSSNWTGGQGSVNVDTGDDQLTWSNSWDGGGSRGIVDPQLNDMGGVAWSQTYQYEGSDTYYKESQTTYDNTGKATETQSRQYYCNGPLGDFTNCQTFEGDFPSNGGGDTGGGDTGGGDTGGGDTGGGDTGGGDTGGGDTGEEVTDCAEYGCATESTLNKVFLSLTGTDYGNAAGIISNEVNNLEAEQSQSEDGLIDQMAGMFSEFMDSGIFDNYTEYYDQLNPLNQFAGDNCSINTTLWGKSYIFSYCDEQPMIHSIIAFMLFIWLLLAVKDLIFERPRGS